LEHNWAKVGTVYSKMGGRGIPRICRGEPRNFANGAAEFGKICRGKLWALPITAELLIVRQKWFLTASLKQASVVCDVWNETLKF